jgi:predicted nucleic acid-binding protein
MAPQRQRLAVDCSLGVKWKIPTEPYAVEAREVYLDWQHGAIEVCAPVIIQAELTSAFLRAFRKGRVTEAEATDAIRELLALPFGFYQATAVIGLRAFALARQHNQGAFDCIYLTIAEQEGIELWTGDLRLYNALHGQYPFVRWVVDYVRKRP